MTSSICNVRRKRWGSTLRAAIGAMIVAVLAIFAVPAHAQDRPNILVIMGDDVGWFNIGAYHQGIMASRTPNLDRLAAQGMRFTDYYAEASCTAGRANFIRTAADPHRIDDGGPGRLAPGLARGGADDRHRAQVDGLCHRTVRKEPPR